MQVGGCAMNLFGRPAIIVLYSAKGAEISIYRMNLFGRPAEISI